MSETTPTKVCRKCGAEKPLSEFYAHRGGYLSSCKTCKKSYQVDYARRNAEQVRVGAKQRAPRYAEKKKEYAASRKEHFREYHRAWSEKNRERVNEIARASTKRRLPLKALYCRQRYALKKGVPGSHTLADIQRLLAIQGWQCRYCRKSLRDGYHVDHDIPITKGGSNDCANLQLLCRSCNTSKNDAMPEDYLARAKPVMLEVHPWG